MHNAPLKSQKGFTLIEILVVIAILAILAAVVFAALNPVGRFQDSRNSTRRTNVESVLQAIRLYTVDNNGKYPTGITALDTANFGTVSGYQVPMCKSTSPDAANPLATAPTAVCTLASSLAAQLVPKYIQSIPADPGVSNGNYYVDTTSDGYHLVVTNFDMEAGTNSTNPVFYMEN